MEYKLKDISVIIPTMNRNKDLLETLNHIPDSIREIIIVDQGVVNDVWKEDIINRVPIKFIRSVPPSITIARNKGLEYATGSLICYLDDDVTLHANHFKHMIEIINQNPKSEGFAAWKYERKLHKSEKIVDNLKRIFMLGQFTADKAIIRAPYSNTYPRDPKPTCFAQWLAGMNMIFKKEVFDKRKLRFDENLLGYTLAEDIDFTYTLYKLNHKSLVIDSTYPIIHRYSLEGRAETRKMAYINQVDHLYFAMKHNMIGKWWWNTIGIVILKTLSAPIYPSKWINYIISLKYCLSHWNLIKQGKVREWNAS